MKSIIYVGMDVHSTNYTLASYAFGNEQPFAVTQVDPDYKHILLMPILYHYMEFTQNLE